MIYGKVKPHAAPVAAAFLALATVLFAGCGESGGDVEIKGLDPRTGALQGDQPVRISGENFRTDIGYTVYFGNQKSTSVTILDPETLLVSTPRMERTGQVDITIRADDGAAFRLPNAFKYEDMSGSVIENLGEGPAQKKKGNLAY